MVTNDESEDGNWIDDDPRRAEFARSARMLRAESLTGVSSLPELKERMLEMLEARISESKPAGCSMNEFNRRYGTFSHRFGMTPRQLALELAEEQKLLVIKDRNRSVLVHAEGYFRLIGDAAETSSAADFIAYLKACIMEQSP